MAHQICTRCIMDTSDPEIRFDAEGRCCHCTDALARLEKFYLPDARGEQRLAALIAEIKTAGKGKAYDCIIGLSGGADSSYLAYKSGEWGLRTLIFHVDGGWNTEQAQKNVEKLAARLGYDLHVHTVDWEEMKDLQVAYLRSALANQDVPQDHLFFAVLFREAEKAGIRYWLSGSNLVSESILPLAWEYTAMDSRQIKAVHTTFGSRPLRSFPLLSFFEYCKFYGDLPLFQTVRTIKPLNLIPYDVFKARQEMTDAFGWQDYGKKHDESRFTKLFQNHYQPRKFGYEKRRAHFASLIISGVMTRERALAEMEKPLYDPAELEADIAHVCERLEISRSDWESFMALPNRHYTDYPNHEGLIRLGRRVKRLIVKPGQV
ncbi:MAG: N-acetyl sugar amidotransferase [Desulfovibrionaceae bacterium]|nr:N-acetyl sugar amidotransferase [Desulfovibrionaceae bacterium]